MRILGLLISFLLCTSSYAQVVNTEKLRSSDKETKWVGQIDGSLGLTRNKAGETIGFGGRANLERIFPKDRFMLFGGYQLTQFTSVHSATPKTSNFTNLYFLHLRYNHTFSKILTWETFTQVQYDEIQEINIRYLAGLGPRFTLVEKDSLELYFGVLGMYEYEESFETVSEVTEPFEFLRTQRTVRMSSYLSIGWQILPYLGIRHISYYQPDVSNWSDFRIASETNLSVKVTDVLSLETFFQYIYDQEPPVSVPRQMYSFRNGISIRF